MEKTSEPRPEESDARAEKLADALSQALLPFVKDLAAEGERSAVVLGAERINVALEDLLKEFLHPSGNNADPLFTSDGALATFSRRIEMVYRLRLIDSPLKQALNSLRKIRNDFAHATKVESLEAENHANRLKSIEDALRPSDQAGLKKFQDAFLEETKKPVCSRYLGCVMLLLIRLEMARERLKSGEPYVYAKSVPKS